MYWYTSTEEFFEMAGIVLRGLHAVCSLQTNTHDETQRKCKNVLRIIL